MIQCQPLLCLSALLLSSFIPRISAGDTWDGPELSIRASALSPDTVLVSLQTLDSETLTGVQLMYSSDRAGHNWIPIPIDKNVKNAVVQNLSPQTTYYFKAEAMLRLGLKDAVTHVITSPDAAPPPSALNVESSSSNSIKVTWNQERSDEVKGYKVRVEKQQPNQTYRVQSEQITAEQELNVEGISQGAQYRVTVRAYSLTGLGEPSEPVLYPEIPEPPTASPVVCLTPPAALQPVADTPDQPYKLDVRAVRQTSSRLRVMWFLPWGDLKNVARFHIVLTSGSGRKLLDSKLRKKQRSISLRPIASGAKYSVTIEALDLQGNVLVEKNIDVAPVSSERGPSELVLEANEIRDQQARLVWALKHVEPNKLKNIRLTVQKNGPDGARVVRLVLATDTQTILLSKLASNSVFYITVEAIGQDAETFLSSVLTLKTPSPGQVGEPVTGSSQSTQKTFHKKQAILKLLSVNVKSDKATVTWEDEGEPIPEELRKNVKVLVDCKKILPDGSEGPLSVFVSEPGARSFVLKNLDRYGKYQVKARYFDPIPGVEDIKAWSRPMIGQEMV